MVEKIKKICEEISLQPIVILETPRAGQTVDNGMGVDFDLPQWALIFKTIAPAVMARGLYEKLRDAEIELHHFDVSNIDRIDDFINELKSSDGYEVKWRDENYRDPDDIKGALIRKGVSIELTASRNYELRVTYEQVKKYCVERGASEDSHDLLCKVIKDTCPEISPNGSFRGDHLRVRYASFDEKGIFYQFSYEDKVDGEYQGDPDETTKKFENRKWVTVSSELDRLKTLILGKEK